jgi:hypothetical protein
VSAAANASCEIAFAGRRLIRMPTSRRHQKPPGRQKSPGRRRALELLAGAGPSGFPSNMLVEHGFSLSDILELVYGGFATPRAERVANQTRELDISYLRITEAGREALAKAMAASAPTRIAIVRGWSK